MKHPIHIKTYREQEVVYEARKSVKYLKEIIERSEK